MANCSVPNCELKAVYEVILYDFDLRDGVVFFKQDYTCPFICTSHAIENEKGAEGIRESMADVTYPYTNRDDTSGFTIYKPL